MSRATIRRTIPLLITMIVGIIFVIDFYFSNIPILAPGVQTMTKWSTIIWGFAMPYAVLMMIIDHGQIIQRREPGKWYYSIWFIFLVVVMAFLGVTQGSSGPLYLEFFQYLAAPVLSTMTGMLALYSVSASFRSWHARTPEAVVMIISGFLVILGMLAPIGEAIIPQLGPIAGWFNNYLFKAERTVFYIATSLGAMLLGYRTLIGQETGYLRAEAEEA